MNERNARVGRSPNRQLTSDQVASRTVLILDDLEADEFGLLDQVVVVAAALAELLSTVKQQLPDRLPDCIIAVVDELNHAVSRQGV